MRLERKWILITISLLFYVEQSREDESVLLPSQNVSETAFGVAESHFKLVSLDWEHVQAPYLISIWLLLASIAKILFHVNKKFGDAVPDSALLIVVGLVLGYAIHSLNIAHDEWLSLKSQTFFLYLLPPIMLDAGYFMPNRQLFENIDSILLFAILGTIWNTIAIGGTLMLFNQFDLFAVGFSTFEILLFAALISAVDPVAVFAVFEEIGINEFLFINVFGEALFNDSVSVMLYQMCRKFIDIGESRLVLTDYVAGAFSFFVIAIGGIIIGVIMALIVSIITRFTSRVKIVAPVFIFVVPYLAFLTAEMFGVSSILAIVSCGMTMKQYIKGNITHDASSSVKYFVRMLAQCSETVVFMFLGLSTVTAKHQWDTAFVAITITCCVVYRIIGTVVQCAILNRFRTKKFSAVEQFILSYGGLRGAIAFGLTVAIPASIAAREMFLTTCIAVIFFTVFVQGSTIRPLLLWLKVETKDADREDKLIEKIYDRYYDYMMAGLEDIAGLKGKHSIRESFERFNARILKPVLMKYEKRKVFDASNILRAYAKITLQETTQLVASVKKANREAQVMPAHGATVHAFKYWKESADTTHAQPRRFTVKDEDTEQSTLSPENMELLYSMFSELIDRKIKGLQTVASKVPKSKSREMLRASGDESDSSEDDIKDDYMQTFKSKALKENDSVSTQGHSMHMMQISSQSQLRPGSSTSGQLPRRLSLPSMKDLRKANRSHLARKLSRREDLV
ncbi:sodium/hydrogen exchanger family domain-containing protein [Ditylenchus destructor]|uniref:Sodium/hydrogen exchanger n=1 Tax=Ditylenchus destructor TaxID=166010 RepID=A0AAD4MT73_9BILA|nr:sodium/hydrogen exchanger family domain-containing protein [Ditylenchus destructor]